MRERERADRYGRTIMTHLNSLLDIFLFISDAQCALCLVILLELFWSNALEEEMNNVWNHL